MKSQSSLKFIEVAAFAAGRMMLETIHSALKNGESFSFETTLSVKTWLPILKLAKNSGYRLTIYFLYLDRVSENLKRIKERIRRGGHSVPDETVRRRFPKSIENFWKIYRPLADQWFIFNNSKKKPKLIHSKESFDKLQDSERFDFEKAFLLQGRRNK